MDLPDIIREIHATVPEHQVLLSFVNDDDAMTFFDWWEDEGAYLFEQWVKGESA